MLRRTTQCTSSDHISRSLLDNALCITRSSCTDHCQIEISIYLPVSPPHSGFCSSQKAGIWPVIPPNIMLTLTTNFPEHLLIFLTCYNTGKKAAPLFTGNSLTNPMWRVYIVSNSCHCLVTERAVSRLDATSSDDVPQYPIVFLNLHVIRIRTKITRIKVTAQE